MIWYWNILKGLRWNKNLDYVKVNVTSCVSLLFSWLWFWFRVLLSTLIVVLGSLLTTLLPSLIAIRRRLRQLPACEEIAFSGWEKIEKRIFTDYWELNWFITHIIGICCIGKPTKMSLKIFWMVLTMPPRIPGSP